MNISDHNILIMSLSDMVKFTPFPSYEDVVLMLSRRIDLESEYSEYAHQLLKDLYESQCNTKVIKVNPFELIKKQGGITASSACLEVWKMIIKKCYQRNL